MTGRGGADGDVIGLLKVLYDLDEENHAYWKIRSMTVSEAKIEKAKLLKERNKAIFNGGASKPIFRTVGRGRNRRVIMMRRKMHWKPHGGNMHKHKSEKRMFSDNLLMDADVKKSDL